LEPIEALDLFHSRSVGSGFYEVGSMTVSEEKQDELYDFALHSIVGAIPRTDGDRVCPNLGGHFDPRFRKPHVCRNDGAWPDQ
ncbi:MAG: hypothetical protein WA721_20250, partial [Candidatus Binataceae bacterium]